MSENENFPLKNLGVHFSSFTDEWRTPVSVYKSLDAEFGFTYDPCEMTDELLRRDGLLEEWGDVNFCNPPYSKVSDWLRKGYLEWQRGRTVVFLVPSRTDTAWWHDYAMKAHEIRFIRGRLNFDGPRKNPASHNAPFPSAIVIFNGAIRD